MTAPAPVKIHRIHISYDEADLLRARARWECSCGHAGSCSADMVDIAADVHIKPGERRVYTSKEF